MDDFVDLTESPVKIPPSSDTEIRGMSQLEDERASFISENIDVISDALREDKDTEVIEDEDMEILQSQSSQIGSQMQSHELVLDPDTGKRLIEN